MNYKRTFFPRKKRTRRAIFLLELSLAMALGSVLLGLTLVLLVAMLRADPAATVGNTTPQELDRFTDRLRHDLHRAQQVTTPQPTELRLTTPTGDIVYELRDGQCLRRERNDNAENIVPFAIDAKSWLLSGGDQLGRIVTVSFELPPDKATHSGTSVAIVAQLGKFVPRPPAGVE